MKLKNNILSALIISLLLLSACDENVYPRPKGNVRLEYPDANYELFNSEKVSFSFEKSHYCEPVFKGKDWVDLVYPKMKATIHLTNKNIGNDTDALIKEIQELTYKHTVKASGIIENPYTNSINNTEGMLYELTGDAASNIQFYVKNENNNVLSGALYFYVAPNSDSLAPAVAYIKKDIMTLMETINWK